MIADLTREQAEKVIEWILDQEIPIPIERLFIKRTPTDWENRHVTKHEYGVILLEELCKKMVKEYE